MKIERFVWLLLVVIAGGGGWYVGRSNGIAVGQAQAQQTLNSFTASRSGQQGAAGQGGGQGAGGGQGRQGGQGGAGGNRGAGGGQAENGTVDKIDGTTITLTLRDNTKSTVQLNADATIRKQVDGQVSDIKAGDRITAIGTLNGNVFQASAIQMGGFGGGNNPGRAATATGQ